MIWPRIGGHRCRFPISVSLQTVLRFIVSFAVSPFPFNRVDSSFSFTFVSALFMKHPQFHTLDASGKAVTNNSLCTSIVSLVWFPRKYGWSYEGCSCGVRRMVAGEAECAEFLPRTSDVVCGRWSEQGPRHVMPLPCRGTCHISASPQPGTAPYNSNHL